MRIPAPRAPPPPPTRAPTAASRRPPPPPAGTGGRRPRVRPCGLLLRVLHDGPDLDGAVPRARDHGGGLDRVVEIADLDLVEAAQLLLRLGEGAVGRERLAVLHANGRRGGGPVEALAGAPRAAVL